MKGEIRIMDKELKKLLNNYVNVIHGKAFPINPTTHQLHLLLDYIANLEQQCQKQKEGINKAVLELANIDGNLSNSQLSDRICNLIDILKEVE